MLAHFKMTLDRIYKPLSALKIKLAGPSFFFFKGAQSTECWKLERKSAQCDAHAIISTGIAS